MYSNVEWMRLQYLQIVVFRGVTDELRNKLVARRSSNGDQMPTKVGGLARAAQRRQLKQEPRCRKVPLVAIATSIESGSKERPHILDLGAKTFVNKPLQITELIAEMEGALAESKASVVGAQSE